MRKNITLITFTLFFVLNIFIVSASTTISDTIAEKQIKFFGLGFKDYEVELYNADSTGVRFSINGQLTRLLNKGDSYIISEVNISVNDIQKQLNTYSVNFTIYIAGCYRCDFGMSCPQDNCCNGKEVDFTSDNENCGDCGNKCDSNSKCDNGKCVGIINNIDLSNYPNFLIKDGKWDLTTVVGDKSSAINVVAQTYILSSLGKGTAVKNKLASEIADLNQNIISIGNPCVNEISAKIMKNPEPCDKDFQRGKGHIRLYQNNEFYHLIVAGYTDLGTKKAAEILADYKNYKFEGNEYIFEFSGDNGERLTEEKKEAPTKIIEEPKKVEAEIKSETETKIDIKTENEAEQKTVEEEPKIEEKVEPKAEEKQIAKSGNIINKFVTWLLSLFKK